MLLCICAAKLEQCPRIYHQQSDCLTTKFVTSR